ncbi:unnamed protein product, partial [Rotaria magnacalcarata]
MTELNNSTHIVKHEYYPKKKSQLKFENDDAIKQDERYFVKIHAPFEVLLVLVR